MSVPRHEVGRLAVPGRWVVATEDDGLWSVFKVVATRDLAEKVAYLFGPGSARIVPPPAAEARPGLAGHLDTA